MQGKMATKDKNELTKEEQFQKDRRDFLGKSKYAVYMTPLMLSMVVDKDAHASSSPACATKNPPPQCF